MSGGAYSYAYFKLQAIVSVMREVDSQVADTPVEILALSEFIDELSYLLRDAEWYQSGDISNEEFIKRFKKHQKQLKDSSLFIL